MNKHLRSDLIKSVVGSYLKKRQYLELDGTKKIDSSTNTPAEVSVIRGVTDMEASFPNSIQYKCAQNDPTVAETQFNNFKNWIIDLNCPKASEELKSLLFPMFCHIYLEMLTGRHNESALSFLTKHQGVCPPEASELLTQLEGGNEVVEKKVMTWLRSCKYQVSLASESLQLLKQFLIKKSHVLLLQLANAWFDLEEAMACEFYMDHSNDTSSPQTNGYDDSPSLEVDMDWKKLEDIIQKVNDGPPAQTPLLLYSVVNEEQSMTCGRISKDSPYLAAGFSSSEVRLWSLTDEKLKQKNTISYDRIVRLGIDPSISDQMQLNRNSEILSNESSVVLLGHSGPVQDTAFLNGSQLLVSVSMDKTMRAWNLNQYSCSAIYRGHGYPIWCVDVSPLAGYVVTGSHDKTARLWSLELNFPVRIFAGHTQDVDCVGFHPNGSYLATGSSDTSVRLWSVDSGELVRVLDGHRAPVMCLSFSADGNYIATAGEDQRIKVWDLRKSSIIAEYRGFPDTIVSLDWSPKGDFLASCTMNNSVRLWPVTNVSTVDDTACSKVYNLSCNSTFTIKYSPQSTPVCIVGVS